MNAERERERESNKTTYMYKDTASFQLFTQQQPSGN